jgi:GrpB-like predicted nucleotidyltransferase (UPF0157 family)
MSQKKSQTKKIEIVAYDANWTKIFEAEEEIISAALGDNCVAVHHIGSTAVPESREARHRTSHSTKPDVLY